MLDLARTTGSIFGAFQARRERRKRSPVVPRRVGRELAEGPLDEGAVLLLAEADEDAAGVREGHDGAAVESAAERRQGKSTARGALAVWCTLAMLGGGIETKALTEIHGESNQGKTQLCYTIAAASMLPPASG